MDQPRGIDAILQGTPVDTYPDALGVLRAIENAFPKEDGISCFSHLYAEISQAIIDGLANGRFENPPFLKSLAIAFANRYFLALRAWRAAGVGPDGAVPGAWFPLVRDHANVLIHPLQFALAGMNAHIDRDLSVALVDAYTAAGKTMMTLDDAGKPTPEYVDYDTVNDIIGEVEPRVKKDYFDPLVVYLDQALDRRFGDIDDQVAMWTVRQIREAAWINGRIRFGLRRNPVLQAEHLKGLDGLVELASDALLVPVPA